VDEESIADLGGNPKLEILKHDYAFIIDPINETFPYRDKLPVWCISIGVWVKDKPLYGGIYAPGMQRIEYNDDDAAYIIEGAFTSWEWKKKIPILADDEDSAKMYIMTSNSILTSRDWHEHKIPRTSFHCAVLSAMMVISGKAIGFVGGDYLWDFAAFMPIGDKVGVNGYNFKTLEKSSFDTLSDKLQMPDYELVCCKKYLNCIKDNTEHRN
jgi:fructose-1,6-bisphosphatase/inositol monophosphatase family enzyme